MTAQRKTPENALENDPRFAHFAEFYVQMGGNGFKAAKAAGYPEEYARAHAHKLVARLKLKVGPVLRHVGIDEVLIAKRLKKLIRAKEPKWNAATKSWDVFESGSIQLGALQSAIKLLDLEPPKRIAGQDGGAIPIVVHHSIPQPARGK